MTAATSPEKRSSWMVGTWRFEARACSLSAVAQAAGSAEIKTCTGPSAFSCMPASCCCNRTPESRPDQDPGRVEVWRARPTTRIGIPLDAGTARNDANCPASCADLVSGPRTPAGGGRRQCPADVRGRVRRCLHAVPAFRRITQAASAGAPSTLKMKNATLHRKSGSPHGDRGCPSASRVAPGLLSTLQCPPFGAWP